MEHETIQGDVRVGDIFLDETYGRVTRPRHLEEITRDWQRDLVGVVYLSMRENGKYAVLDGNHRVTAARVNEGEDFLIPAHIYLDLTLEEEALYFHDFNRKRKALRPEDEFKAALVAGKPEAIEINAIVESLGLHLGGEGFNDREGFVNGIRAIEQVYESHGANGLREVLLTLRDSMGTGPSAIQAAIMKGLAQFAARYYTLPQFDREHLRAVLSTHSPAQLKGLAHTVRAASPSITASTAIGMAILQLYNGSKKRGQLPPWATTAYGPAARGRQSENARRHLSNLKQAANG